MSKITAITKNFRKLLPSISKTSVATKPQETSIFHEVPQNVRYIHNVFTYPLKRQITPEQVEELFVDGEIYGGYFREEMINIKIKHFLEALKQIFTNPKKMKSWIHSVDLSKKLTKQDLTDIADFMNMHDGKYINVWKDYSGTDFTPNVDKLALFVRSIKRIKLLDYYKNLDEKSWENCIDGIINRPREVVSALMSYKYNSNNINEAISFGTKSHTIKQQISAIKNFLDKQILKHDMIVYRGEGNFWIFNSVHIDKNHTLKQVLEDFTKKIEANEVTEQIIADFVKKKLVGNFVIQSRFMSTAIEPNAIENYAKKVLWKINIPTKTKASFIEGYNVERESEAELLIQMGSKLLIKDAKYDFTNKRWEICADLVQDVADKIIK